jgi:hypothetical protein
MQPKHRTHYQKRTIQNRQIAKTKSLTITTNDFTSQRAISKTAQDTNATTQPYIIVKFKTNTMKKSFKTYNKEHGKITPHSLDQTCEDDITPIYINENLPHNTRTLYRETLAFKKKNNYQYAWTRDGQIMLRKNSNTITHKINTSNDLHNIQNAHDTCPDWARNQVNGIHRPF